MSHNKSLQMRTILTLGAAAFALCVGTAPTMAAGHEGRAGGVAARGGGAGETRSMNERFDSMRVESLSPAGFVNPSMSSEPRPAVSSEPGNQLRASSGRQPRAEE